MFEGRLPDLSFWGSHNYLNPVALELLCHQNDLEGLLTKSTDSWASPREFLIQEAWSGAEEFLFLASSLVMLMLLVHSASTV